MKYAILSDIHSNLEALTTVLADVDKQFVDQIVCLGDVIGYGANPNECCELLLERNPHIIKGNHEHAAINLQIAQYFNITAKEAAIWTYHTLKEKYKNVIHSLTDIKQVDNDFVMVHGALTHRNDYIFDEEHAEENLKLFKTQFPEVNICFYGHSHMKEIWGPLKSTPTKDVPPSKLSFHLQKKDHYLINPGSVGQPRDGDPKASYLIFDTELMKVTYHLLKYDIEKTKNKILSAGLPATLARRLDIGS